jgi:hypothetical protein
MAASTARVALAPTAGLSATADRLSLEAAASVAFGALKISARAGHSDETGALLGTRLSPGFGLLGGRTASAGGALDLDVGQVTVRAAASHGWHDPRFAAKGLMHRAGLLHTNAWSLSAGFAALGGRFDAHIAQPLALTGGGFMVGTAFAEVRPDARETTHELGFSRATRNRGQLNLTAYQRSNAGNREGLFDSGVAVRLVQDF